MMRIEQWISGRKVRAEVDNVKKRIWITTMAVVFSCMLAVPTFAGKWAGDDGGWRYVRDDGSYQGDGWLEDKGNLYYISNGYMKNGWIKDNGKDYFMGVTGAMMRDAITPDGFKVGSDGAWLGQASVVDERGFTTPFDDHSYFLDENSLQLVFDAETDYAEELGRRDMGDIAILAAIRGRYPLDGLNEKEYAVYQKACEFIKGFDYNQSEYNKAVAVYHYIQNRAIYNEGAFEPDDDTIYGVLILGKSKCVGFSRAYKLLCNAVGLRCGLSENAAHVWNSVSIDGEWKGIDASTIGTSAEFYLERAKFACPVCGTKYTFGARESAWTCPVCRIEYDNPNF